MPSDEPFSARKFFTGFIDPALIRKALPLLWWMLILFVLFLGAVKVKNYFFPRQSASPVQVQNNSGCIETGADKRNKFGIINF